MSDESNTPEQKMVAINSTRFGELEVPAESVIDLPAGLIGFPTANKFVLIEHKAPFSWFHSVDDPNLAFVVIDGAEFGQAYNWKPPVNDKECEFKEDDEFAILIIVTVRSDPSMTTANLKAPLFVNIRNRKGVQVIFDDPRYSTRHPLWAEEEKKEGAAEEKKEDGK